MAGFDFATCRGVPSFHPGRVGSSTMCLAEVLVGVIFLVRDNGDCRQDAHDEWSGVDVSPVFLLEADRCHRVEFSGLNAELRLVGCTFREAAGKGEAIGTILAGAFVEGGGGVRHVRGLSSILGGDVVREKWGERDGLCCVWADNVNGVRVDAICQKW